MNVYLAGMMLLAVGWGAGSAGAEEVVLDDFGYRSVDAARAVWRPAEASPPVEVAAQGPVKALQLPCRFAQDDRRSAYDRSGEWNLSGCTRFTVELNVPQPAALHHFSIYFRSGEGWLGFHPGVNEAGWHTIL